MREAPIDDAVSLARLRSMQRTATGLLFAAAAIYAVARVYESRYPAVGYLRAFCEAAMVGGLADWFAVTALFRHPLGVPLPHTAIIPSNKERIGEALGRFVERNFLSTEVVAAKLGEADLAGTAARWLSQPERSAMLAGHVAAFLPRLLDAAGDEPMRRFLHRRMVEGLRRIDMAPLAADVLETLTAGNRHQELVDEVVLQTRRLLSEAEPEVRARVRQKTAWLWQKLGVDEAISDRLISAAEETLAEVAVDPEHAWRQRFTDLVREYVVRLRTSPEYARRAEALKQSLLDHPALATYIGSIWDEVRTRVREDTAREDSGIRTGLRSALVRLGDALLAEPEVREAINAGMRKALGEIVERRRHEVAELIAQTVRRWDARTVSERIERAIGRDLQYIRINGTVIGGLVGVVIHAVSKMIG
ncbi:MAG TPA: DUF445 domain-containing protein [Burkholderiales bacterium]|nr:DUF445 domain-containing protein [Burkholderiales bacterium]